jgi:hypothetical protein
MKVLLRQTIDLYGVRYSVGMRDIPDGHCCGADWDSFVKAGWVVVQDKPKAVETVVVEAAQAEPVADVVESDAADDAVVEAVEVVEAAKPKRKKKD